MYTDIINKLITVKKITKFNFINLVKILLRLINKYFIYFSNLNPLTNKPLMNQNYFTEIAKHASRKIYPAADDFERQSDYKIDSKWINELALLTQVVKKDHEICYAHGRILYSLIRKKISSSKDFKNICIFETGTARGFSSLCMAKALDDSNAIGKIITLDQLPHHQPIYWNNVTDHLVGKISRKELLKDWSELIEKYIIFLTGDSRILVSSLNLSRVHFAFLDGCHTYKDVHLEFNVIKESQFNGDIVVFDDYTNNLYSEVVNAVNEICEKYSYSKKIIHLNEKRSLLIATKK